MADTFDRAESAPGIKPIQSTSGRIYKTFGPPSQEHAALEVRLCRCTILAWFIFSDGSDDVGSRAGCEKAHGQDTQAKAVHYPSIHRSKKTVEEVIAALKVNVETGLDSETAAELLKEDMELDKGGLVAVGDSAEKAGLELALERDVERVIRDGREQTLHALDLVRGDVLSKFSTSKENMRTTTSVELAPSKLSLRLDGNSSTEIWDCAPRNVPDYGDFISPNGLPDAQRVVRLAFARTTRCPVLTWRIVLPGATQGKGTVWRSSPTTRCAVLMKIMLLPGGEGGAPAVLLSRGICLRAVQYCRSA
eukprot:1255975-Rhodomonas_salina.1